MIRTYGKTLSGEKIELQGWTNGEIHDLAINHGCIMYVDGYNVIIARLGGEWINTGYHPSETI